MRILHLLFVFLVLSSCKGCKEKESDELCSKKTPYLSNDLRVDGYYYVDYDNPPGRKIIFLFRNGVLLYGSLVDMEELSIYEESYSNGSYYNAARANENVWGNFRLAGSSIFYEKWYPSTNNQVAFIHEGEILTDSTFRIIKTYRCDGSGPVAENELFQFKHVPSKPDSTNQFVN
jgi:hypothetical protein